MSVDSMYISRKLQHQLMSLRDADESNLNNKRAKWVEAYTIRKKFLDELRTEGITGTKYSDAVVKFDKDHMVVFAA